MAIEFSPSFPLEELEERVNQGHFDEEVYTYLYETLKEDSNDSKELIRGEISPYDFFELSISERGKGWKSHYISSMEHGTVDKEIITLLKNRIDKLFDKAKADFNKEIKIKINNLKEISNKYVKSTNETLKEFMEELKKDCKSYKEVKEKLMKLEKDIIWSKENEKVLNIEFISYAKSLLDKEINEWLINQPLIKCNEMEDINLNKETALEGSVQEQLKNKILKLINADFSKSNLNIEIYYLD